MVGKEGGAGGRVERLGHAGTTVAVRFQQVTPRSLAIHRKKGNSRSFEQDAIKAAWR